MSSQSVRAEARSSACPSRELLSDLLDNALPLLRRVAVGRHVKRCADCTHTLAAEARLRNAAKAVGAHTVAPETLRRKLRAQIAAPAGEISPAAPRRSPTAFVLTATGIGAVALLAVVLLRPVFMPLPAYAQVVQAMRNVRTARWTETSTEYNAATRKTLRFTVRQEARLNPPALSTTFDFSHSYKQVVTPKRTFVKRRKGAKTITEPGFYPLNIELGSAAASTTLRQRILDQLTAPEEKGNGPVQWRSAKERVDGRDLVRFILGTGAGNDRTVDNQTRLTRIGYRWRIWVDPKTLRVVKSEREYYDGTKYSQTVGENYEYDVPLPSNTFSER